MNLPVWYLAELRDRLSDVFVEAQSCEDDRLRQLVKDAVEIFDDIDNRVFEHGSAVALAFLARMELGRLTEETRRDGLRAAILVVDDAIRRMLARAPLGVAPTVDEDTRLALEVRRALAVASRDWRVSSLEPSGVRRVASSIGAFLHSDAGLQLRPNDRRDLRDFQRRLTTQPRTDWQERLEDLTRGLRAISARSVLRSFDASVLADMQALLNAGDSDGARARGAVLLGADPELDEALERGDALGAIVARLLRAIISTA